MNNAASVDVVQGSQNLVNEPLYLFVVKLNIYISDHFRQVHLHGLLHAIHRVEVLPRRRQQNSLNADYLFVGEIRWVNWVQTQRSLAFLFPNQNPKKTIFIGGSKKYWSLRLFSLFSRSISPKNKYLGQIKLGKWLVL